MKKNIVILAKSAKRGNYCVAGIELGSNRWIRPVSNDEDIQGAVHIETAAEIQPLDVVQIEFAGAAATDIQPENFFYTGAAWKKFAHWSLADFEKFCGLDGVDVIFYDTSRRIEPEAVENFRRRQSLLILPIENISVNVSQFGGEMKFHASFDYGGTRYENFGVSDIALREKFSAQGFGEFPVAESAIATFSLTAPFKDGRCYKMLAQFFGELQPAR